MNRYEQFAPKHLTGIGVMPREDIKYCNSDSLAAWPLSLNHNTTSVTL